MNRWALFGLAVPFAILAAVAAWAVSNAHYYRQRSVQLGREVAALNASSAQQIAAERARVVQDGEYIAALRVSADSRDTTVEMLSRSVTWMQAHGCVMPTTAEIAPAAGGVK